MYFFICSAFLTISDSQVEKNTQNLPLSYRNPTEILLFSKSCTLFRDFGEWNRNGLFLFRCSRWLVGNIKSPCAASLSKTSRTRTYTQRFIQFSRTPYPQAQLRNHSAFRQSHLSAIPQQIYFAIQTEPIQRGLR